MTNTKTIILTESQVNRLLEANASEIEGLCAGMELHPTDAQKKAGNYRMAHFSVKGFPITIETPKGSFRTYRDANGRFGSVEMKNHYGYFTNTTGNGKDGDAVDVFIGDSVDDFDFVYVVDQNKANGEFDESKVMLGFKTEAQARKAYMSNYSKDWKGFRGITAVSIELFRKWLYRGAKQRKPFADYVSMKKVVNETLNNPYGVFSDSTI